MSYRSLVKCIVVKLMSGSWNSEKYLLSSSNRFLDSCRPYYFGNIFMTKAAYVVFGESKELASLDTFQGEF